MQELSITIMLNSRSAAAKLGSTLNRICKRVGLCSELLLVFLSEKLCFRMKEEGEEEGEVFSHETPLGVPIKTFRFLGSSSDTGVGERDSLSASLSVELDVIGAVLVGYQVLAKRRASC